MKPYKPKKHPIVTDEQICELVEESRKMEKIIRKRYRKMRAPAEIGFSLVELKPKHRDVHRTTNGEGIIQKLRNNKKRNKQ